MDYFVAFELKRLVNYRLFPLHQGIEKLCKAYLLAKRASEWVELEPEVARAKWIERCVRGCGHDLWDLVKQVADDFPQMIGFVAGDRNKSFLDLLTMAYEESRYPKPTGQSIWDKHGFPALVTYHNEEQAYALGSIVLDGIREHFQIAYPTKAPVYSGIDLGDWERFRNNWKSRSRKELQ